MRSSWTIFHGRPLWTPGPLWIPDLGLGPALPMLPKVVELQGRDQRTEATCGSIPWKFPVMGPMGIIFGKKNVFLTPFFLFHPPNFSVIMGITFGNSQWYVSTMLITVNPQVFHPHLLPAAPPALPAGSLARQAASRDAPRCLLVYKAIHCRYIWMNDQVMS